MDETRLVLARARVNCVDGLIPVRILNPSLRPIQMRQGATLGTLEPVEQPSVRAVTEEGPEVRATEPCSVRQQIDLSQSDLLPRQKEQLLDLIESHAGAFASDSVPLGRTDLVMHRISTGDTHPIKPRHYRVPVNIRNTEEQEIEQTMDLKIIRRSNSSWASPVVIVLKRI